VLTIARRQPMAIDLREIVGAMRVATDLERIGDLAKNMGKRVAALENDFQPLKLIRGLEHMTDLVLSQVKSVLDAYCGARSAGGRWRSGRATRKSTPSAPRCSANSSPT
jgi:phosphate uptake regulator